MIAIPTVDGWIHSRLVRSIMPQMTGRPLCIMAGLVPLEKARNQIVETFMQSDCTHLFMVDADTVPPPDAIDKLLALEEDIATGITPIVNKDDLTSNVFLTNEEEASPMPLDSIQSRALPFEITAVGLSCVLIKRTVFEKMKKPYFTSFWFENGKFCEGDVNFCGKAKDAGFKIMADPRIKADHVKEIIL